MKDRCKKRETCSSESYVELFLKTVKRQATTLKNAAKICMGEITEKMG